MQLLAQYSPGIAHGDRSFSLRGEKMFYMVAEQNNGKPGLARLSKQVSQLM